MNKLTLLFLLAGLTFLSSCKRNQLPTQDQTDRRFNIETDLLLVHYDCKTDVDDLHSVAAFGSLIQTKQFSQIDYLAIAGTYGTQEGLYVPGESLFEMAFDENWRDAHGNYQQALNMASLKCQTTLGKNGNIWIADAGQSDYTNSLVEKIIAFKPALEIKNRIYVVQHSDWNEKVTSQDKLENVKKKISYHKIADGNFSDNGTPSFNTGDNLSEQLKGLNNKTQKLWQHAIELGNTFNGKDGRYLNESIQKGGLDFSDFSEVHWILEIEGVDNCQEYLEYLKNS